MSEGKYFDPQPIKSPENFEKNTLKSGESDSGLSWGNQPINTFDDIRNESKQKISTFDDIRDKKDGKGIRTFDDLRKENDSSESELGGEKSKPKIREANNAHDKWDKVAGEIDNAADKEGYRIDEGIKEAVIALNAFEINTGQSCEGHIDNGRSAPWIRIEAPNEPEERFVGQNKAFEKVAKKYNMSSEEVKRMFNADAYWEAMSECKDNGETEEFKKWESASEKLLYTTKEILKDFYNHRQVSDAVKIKVDTESIADMSEGSFEIFNGGDDNRDINDIKLSEEEKESLGKRLKEYRKEMQEFAGFLKDKFFNRGEEYMSEKRSKAQEIIDQEKMNKIKEKLKETETEIYVKENLKNFENFQIKKLSELPYWNKIDKFLAGKGIADNEVIIVDDEEKWKSIYGSNDSKSSSKPKAIILKKEVFGQENISDENISWLIHEIGHMEFYENLGEKLEEYMDNFFKSGEYTSSTMESAAFQLQFEYLKTIGKTKEECLNLLQSYIDKTFGRDEDINNAQSEQKHKEIDQLVRYLDNVYTG